MSKRSKKERARARKREGRIAPRRPASEIERFLEGILIDRFQDLMDRMVLVGDAEAPFLQGIRDTTDNQHLLFNTRTDKL